MHQFNVPFIYRPNGEIGRKIRTLSGRRIMRRNLSGRTFK